MISVVETFTLSLGVTQILAQLGAVYLAYRLTKTTGAFLAWSLVIIALVLMTVRRVTALMIELGSMPALGGSIAFIDRILLPLAISILLLFGIYDLVRAFERQSHRS